MNKNFEIYTCTVHSNSRTETAENLKDLAISKGFEAKSFDNISKAVKAAGKCADKVFAVGSLYMYKELFNKNGELK